MFETYFGYWVCLIAVNMQIYLETLSPQRASNVPKLPGINYFSKNWALVVILKALPWALFSSALLLEWQMITAVKNIKHPCQISDICPQNSHKISCFLPIVFRQS